jgi:ATP-dependent Lon protease
MHSRQEIIKNQSLYENEIMGWLKEDFKQVKRDLRELEYSAHDEYIKKAQKKLLAKANKVKIEQEMQKLFINIDNIYPRFYAWWNEQDEEAVIYKYIDEAR